MKRVYEIMLAVVASFAITAPAMAETPLSAAIHNVFEGTVLPVLVALIGALVSYLLIKTKNWLNIKTTAEVDEWIGKRAEEAVQFAGEFAADKLKASNIKLASSEKLNTAVAYLVNKVPSLTREQAETCVTAALARVYGEGATGEKTVVVAS